jgi:hypothetical protein
VEVVSTSNGPVLASRAYTYNPLPVIRRIFPASGPLTGGTTVTVDGSGFGGTVSIAVGTVPATVSAVDPAGTRITCLTPSSPAAGARDVSVASTTHGVTVSAAGYRYIGAVPAFSGAQVFAAGGSPLALAVADFNTDGRPDVVTANGAGNAVSVHLNTTAVGAGAASFAPPLILLTVDGADDVGAGDIDGDGRPDLVVPGLTSGVVQVFLNTTPSGAAVASFAARTDVRVLPDPPPAQVPLVQHVLVADVNADSRPDVVIADTENSTVTLLVNTTAVSASAPGFALPAFLPAPAGDRAVLGAGDLDADGRADLVIGTSGNAAPVLVARANRTTPGSAALSFDVPVGLSPLFVDDLAVADLNRDGRPDLSVTTAPTPTLPVIFDTTPGRTAGAPFPALSFASPVAIQLATLGRRVAVADVNRDSVPDLVVLSEVTRDLTVFPNATPEQADRPIFGAPLDVFLAGDTQDLATGDVNRDGREDLLTADGSTGSFTVILNTTP